MLLGQSPTVKFGLLSLTNLTWFKQKAVLRGEGMQLKEGMAVI